MVSRHLGLLAFMLLVVGLTFVVTKWPYGINRTFSQHVARHKTAVYFYIVFFVVVLALLLSFFLGWFIPTFSLGLSFTLLVVGSAAFQFACTLVPETGGTKSKIHRYLAFVSADLLLPAVIIMAFTDAFSAFSKITSLIMATIMSAIIIVMVKNNAEHKYLLILQAVYFLAFFIAVLVSTYL